ncbi:MAG TPA: maleylpyruvate isomerase family mycothiol-dependent enzyme [Pseudonocardia sp.]|jgi:uncharacterized protein (TIGR03083 family)|uniref:maleylpyruvate isomerase family mycothiol-dependent enzyme n=1 Tax=Pseudonocardia sp. TaxID=60912 RepID=UPI002B4ADB7B|nr:maleylpyruvate isomerase family mycothiol-dependent enzyme [Pseudonocardia sp.]HLU56638.1 maleylpyruvate isomerase family mycothiol-dependent enzyme [Pseudonocardia sp.]
MTATDTRAPARPRRSLLDRNTAMRLAATEYGRYLDLLRSLDEADWARPTDCPPWDVRAMTGHCLGMAEFAASLPTFVHQNAAATRRGGVPVDALTDLQVHQRRDLTPEQLIARYAAVAPRAVRGRRRRSLLVGRVAMPGTQTVGGVPERWTFGYLFETILTRDTWMHRVDTARATGRDLVLTPEHDGVIVADVVAEWAGRHGRPYALTLTGPAGGRWTAGEGPEMQLDAVEFCRILSGRTAAPAGLLATQVPF